MRHGGRKIWAKIPAVTASNWILSYINVARKMTCLVALVRMNGSEPPTTAAKDANVHSVHHDVQWVIGHPNLALISWIPNAMANSRANIAASTQPTNIDCHQVKPNSRCSSTVRTTQAIAYSVVSML